MKINKIYIIIGIILFTGYAIFYAWNSSNLLDKDGIYTIGKIEKVEGGGRGGLRAYISFSYKNIQHEGDYIDGSGKIKERIIGTRYFIKILPTHLDRAFDFNIDYPITDSILVAPPEGWSQDWMKKHFPTYVK